MLVNPWNPDDFRLNKPELIKILKKQMVDSEDLVGEVCTLAQAYGVALTVIYTFVIE